MLKRESEIFKRRNFLKSGFSASVIGLFLPQEQQYRITAKKPETHQHSTSESVERDPITAALQKKVGTLRGFDPMRFLTAFDYGKVSKLEDGRTVRDYELTAHDVEVEVASGIFFPAWTFNHTVPGPTLRCTEGDLIRVRFLNRSVSDHTIHFHGIHPANMDGSAEPVKPNESYTYEFTAEPFGLQFYHCHTPPVSLHMNRGLFGALIIDPRKPRTKAKELVMIAHGWDINFDNRNEIYALNGPANYYRDHPIVIHAGELVRIFFINALEFDPINSFHLHASFC